MTTKEQKAAWYIANRATCIARCSAYNKQYKKTPRGRAITAHTSRVRLIPDEQRPPLSRDERRKIINVYEAAQRLTLDTGIQYSVDHIKPICCGGLHVLENLQLIPLTENWARPRSGYDAV